MSRASLKSQHLLLPRGLLLDADGDPIPEAEAAIHAERTLRSSPYTSPARTPMYKRVRKEREAAQRSKRDPAIRARKRVGHLVQEMMKIGNDLKDFRVAAEADPRTQQAQRKRMLSGGIPQFVAPGKTTKRQRPREMPKRLRAKRDKLAAVSATDLLMEWRKHDNENGGSPLDSRETPRDHPCKTDQSTERIVQSALETSTSLPGVQSVRELPSRRDIVAACGHAPKFYGVKRHPPPGRLPSCFATSEGKETFKVVPKTDWRDAPEETVLQKAYAYMLDNIAVSEEIDLAVTASEEMQANLEDYFDANIGRGCWQDEVTSIVAEPLGMEAYCAQRGAQEVAAPSAAAFAPELVQEEPSHETKPKVFARVDPRALKSASPPRQASPSQPAPPYYVHDGDHAVLALNLPASREGEVFRFSREAAEAATLIQRQWRRVLGKSHRAATILQKRARGMAGRRRVEMFRREKVAYLVVIQAQVRAWLGRRILGFLRMAKSYNMSLAQLHEWELVRIPGNVKISLARQRAEDARLRRDREVGKRFANIQSRVRSSIAHKHVAKLRYLRKHQELVARHLQRIFRGNKTRHDLETMRRAVRIGVAGIQARFRGNVQRRRYRELLTLRERKAHEIQRIYRGHCGRLAAAHKRLERASATKMCALARGAKARRFVRRWKASRVEAERRRLGLENMQLRKTTLEVVGETKAYLKTKEGKREFRAQIQRAKASRIARKEARTRMTPEELRRSLAEEAFELFDLDGSGEIDEAEFRRAVAELCLPLTKSQIRIALEAMDENGDGVVTLQEFIRWHGEGESSAPKRRQKKNKNKNKKKDEEKKQGGKMQHGVTRRKSRPFGKTILDDGDGDDDDDDESDDDDDFEDNVGVTAPKGAGHFAWAKAANQMNATVTAAIKLKLKTTKAMRDLSGYTDRRAASRSIYAARAEAARTEARAKFRASHPADEWYHKYWLGRNGSG